MVDAPDSKSDSPASSLIAYLGKRQFSHRECLSDTSVGNTRKCRVLHRFRVRRSTSSYAARDRFVCHRPARNARSISCIRLINGRVA